MAAVIDLPLVPTSEIIFASFTVQLDLKNVGAAFGILLQACSDLLAEMLIITCPHPVDGGPPRFIT